MKRRIVIALMLLGCAAEAGLADIHEYVGPTSLSNWNAAADWSPAQLPETNGWARISGGSRIYVTDHQTVRSVFIENASA